MELDNGGVAGDVFREAPVHEAQHHGSAVSIVEDTGGTCGGIPRKALAEVVCAIADGQQLSGDARRFSQPFAFLEQRSKENPDDRICHEGCECGFLVEQRLQERRQAFGKQVEDGFCESVDPSSDFLAGTDPSLVGRCVQIYCDFGGGVHWLLSSFRCSVPFSLAASGFGWNALADERANCPAILTPSESVSIEKRRRSCPSDSILPVMEWRTPRAMRIPRASNAAMGTMMWKANMAVAESKASVPVMSRIAASILERLRLTRSAGGLVNNFMMMVLCLSDLVDFVVG